MEPPHPRQHSRDDDGGGGVAQTDLGALRHRFGSNGPRACALAALRSAQRGAPRVRALRGAPALRRCVMLACFLPPPQWRCGARPRDDGYSCTCFRGVGRGGDRGEGVPQSFVLEAPPRCHHTTAIERRGAAAAVVIPLSCHPACSVITLLSSHHCHREAPCCCSSSSRASASRSTRRCSTRRRR